MIRSRTINSKRRRRKNRSSTRPRRGATKACNWRNRDSLRHQSKSITNQHHTTKRQDLPVPKTRKSHTKDELCVIINICTVFSLMMQLHWWNKQKRFFSIHKKTTYHFWRYIFKIMGSQKLHIFAVPCQSLYKIWNVLKVTCDRVMADIH